MRLIPCVIALVCMGELAACASGTPEAKQPIRLEVNVNARATVNPDDEGRAAPIVVRIYQLKSEATFNTADFFTLQERDKALLGDELVMREQLELRPGEQLTIRRIVNPSTTVIGVLAAYRNLPASVWRATYPTPEAPVRVWYRLSAMELKLNIVLDTDVVSITGNR